jgi:hypothetical protein
VSLWDITAPNQLFSATYKVYVGDSQGNEILNPDGTSASTTEVWTWQGPASLTTPEIMISQKVAVEWPAACTNYVLECAETLDSTEWTCITNQPVSINGTSVILLDHKGAEQYFRLRLVR